MGIGPVPAIQNVLKVAGMTVEEIDLIEVCTLLIMWINLICFVCRLMKLLLHKLWLVLSN